MFPPCIYTFHVGYISLSKVYLTVILKKRQSSWLCMTKIDVTHTEYVDTCVKVTAEIGVKDKIEIEKYMRD